MSTLRVGTIQSTTANTALTIDSAGVVDLSANNNVTVFTLTSQTSITSTTPATITGF